MKQVLLTTGLLLLSSIASVQASDHPWLDKQLAKQRYPCPVGDSPVRGNAQAPVTIVEFADFDCNYCADEEKTLKKLLSDYPTQIRIAFKNLPLVNVHPDAKKKAILCDCMGAQGKFWEAYEKLMSGAPMKDVRRGVDEQQLNKCIAQGGTGQVDKDLALAKKLGMATTPGFVIDGIRQGGTIGAKQFAMLIDSEVERKTAHNQ